MRPLLFLLALSLPLAPLATAQELPSVEEKTSDLVRMDGLFPIYWDADEGKIWLEIGEMERDFLYVVSLPAGLGSNDVGLDRGQLGGERLVRFERAGPEVLLVEPNLRYRAETENEAERQAVEDAFAESVVWGFPVAAQTSDSASSDTRVLVDATDFVVRDAHGVARRLKETGQGTFGLDASRSAPYPAMLKAFPRNTEMEARLTFTTDEPGRYVQDVAADPYAPTVRVRHSFVALPEPGFEPRPFHVGAGYYPVGYEDYAVPIGEPTTQRFIARHRLEKKDPSAAMSEAVEPIVYYLDPGTPEPVRGALLDGARWWNEAFEAAGFQGAFRVEVLPDSADPMDVRYNTIQWVHRATRGWSYGSSVQDPRTGEIIKGHVTLGSLRVRQDYLIAEGLLSPYRGEHAGGFPEGDDPLLEMALARIRQLSAHEVGHTLGLAHNFAASVNGRASVMDYPAPFATLTDSGTVSLDDAYDEGIGAWDKVAIRYGYAQFREGADVADSLRQLLADAADRGLYYVTDQDARPAGAAHPLANLWDNGDDVLSALDHEMRVRRAALERFGLTSIRSGRPVAQLEDVLVPLYLRHRYQVEATVKAVGGVLYGYALRGDAQALPEPIPAAAQRAALDGLLETVTPEALRLPTNLRTLIPPRPPGYDQTRELFTGHTGLTFDPYAPAQIAAYVVLSGLVHGERLARLAYQEDFDPDLPSLSDMLARTSEVVWERSVLSDPYDAELQRIVQGVWTDALLETAAGDDLAPAVRARVVQHLRGLQGWLEENPGRRRDAETVAHRALAFDEIDRFLFRLYDADEATRAEITVPPGSPIGDEAPAFVRRQRQRQSLLERWDTSTDACGG